MANLDIYDFMVEAAENAIGHGYDPPVPGQDFAYDMPAGLILPSLPLLIKAVRELGAGETKRLLQAKHTELVLNRVDLMTINTRAVINAALWHLRPSGESALG